METYELKGVVPPAIVEKSNDVKIADTLSHESHEITKEEFDEMRKIVEPFAPQLVVSDSNVIPDFDAAPQSEGLNAGIADNEARRKLIRKISAYVSVFKNECRDLDCKNLGKRSTNELYLLLEDVEFMVSTRRTLDKTRGVFVMGCIAGEEIGQMLGLKLKGFAGKIVNEPEILSTWDELSIKYDSAIMTDPVHRLSLSLLMVAMATHKENSSISSAAVPASSAPPQKLSKKAQKIADELAATAGTAATASIAAPPQTETAEPNN
jgi:hypothetical protein